MTNTIAKKQNGNAYGSSLGKVVDEVFQNSLHRFFDDEFWGGNRVKSGIVPVNVRETEKQYELDVIAPGCRKEDFNIRLEDNMLVVSMEAKEENQKSDAKNTWVRNEYSLRSFSRSFTLDETVDLNQINATYTDGILRISLAKSEKAARQTRSISVK
jgi:HSP20 family protein